MAKVQELNALGREEFTSALAPVFEHSSWVAEETWPRRPFRDAVHLHAELCATMRAASPERQLALIRAHPDLVGRDLLTAESKSEQASAGLGELSSEEIERFREYNARYRERFGFPFVICARLNKKQAILDALPIRLQNSREKETEIALREIFKIADLRLQDLVE